MKMLVMPVDIFSMAFAMNVATIGPESSLFAIEG